MFRGVFEHGRRLAWGKMVTPLRSRYLVKDPFTLWG